MASSSTKILMGAGLAGLAAGILFAPKSGKETRADMKRKAQELSDQANQKFEAGKEKAADLKQQAIEHTKKVRSSIRKKDGVNESLDSTISDDPMISM